MTIELSPALQKRVLREAKARGIPPGQIVEEALKIYFKPASAKQESAARRELRALLKHKKETDDFLAQVRRARRRAGKLIADNEDWIDQVSARGSEHRRG